jgi:hypothetical protein
MYITPSPTFVTFKTWEWPGDEARMGTLGTQYKWWPDYQGVLFSGFTCECMVDVAYH